MGRLPIGWLQLTHNRTRLVAAMAGVAFANILVFVQLGMLGALQDTIGATYSLVQADILISSSDANTLADGSPLTRRVMFQALAEPGVAAAAPLYLGQTDWTRPDGDPDGLRPATGSRELCRFCGGLRLPTTRPGGPGAP